MRRLAWSLAFGRVSTRAELDDEWLAPDIAK
jgi:hypothetical protein